MYCFSLLHLLTVFLLYLDADISTIVYCSYLSDSVPLFTYLFVSLVSMPISPLLHQSQQQSQLVKQPSSASPFQIEQQIQEATRSIYLNQSEFTRHHKPIGFHILSLFSGWFNTQTNGISWRWVSPRTCDG